MNTEDVVKFLGDMKVVDLIALTKELENKWDLKAEPQVTQVQMQQQQVDVKTDQSEFSVVLVNVPAPKKIATIKLLRELTGLGLVDCKAIIEKLPQAIKENMSKHDADGMKMKLDEVGAISEIK